jgi:hypothetical protein
VNDRIIGAVFAVTMFEIPLIISSWLLIKSVLVKIKRIRSLSYSEHDRKNDVIKVIIVSIIILILFFAIIFPIVIAIAPEILFTLPMSLRVLLLFLMLIIYVHIYGSFYAIFRWLGDVVGAGGSASNVIKQLQGYLYEALEINEKKKNNNTKNK